MKKQIVFVAMGIVMVSYLFSSCAPKYGCPSNGKNVGAERILSGEKVPKAKSFKE